ncbi:hypothetical protein [Pseudomonas sp. PB106]|uniref:hypothetical protein n=1 Tax=Pseudomonas sp. PB106 TaxID=2494699 RepID=UPI00131ADACA|nr:hypothetical protein [Pseudomonas sp. PB106]KAE9643007.1 hypothetical protein EJA71_18020 [Pseudomonas sp. PB106]
MKSDYEHQQAYLQLYALATEQNVELCALRSFVNGDDPKSREPDRNANKPYIGSMNDITREEFNAKLETIEVKMDARIESVSSKIDSFVAIQAERDKRMEEILKQISSNHAETKASIGSMKTTMIVTAVSTVLAIVIGIAGFNAMLTSNMIASFQMGRSEKAFESQQVQPTEPATPSAQKK